ncbi:MAG: ABC transporter substrate-binding protein [Acinetobacter sp.]
MSKITRRALIKNTGLGLGTIAAASLIGCSRSDSSASNEAATHTSQHTTPQKGGVIKIGVINGNQAGNLDAHKPIGMSSAFRGWPLYAKLWEWGRDIQPKLALAEFAEPNEDGTKWTIRLKKGLEFHHAKTITADDVIFSLRRLTDPKLASPFAAYLYSLQRDAIKKRDDYTVEIPFAQGKGLVALPEAWMSWGGIVPTDYDPIKNVVGAGPFKLESFTPGQRSRFVRFENYFKNDRPYADSFEIIDFKDQISRLNALLSGQIDIANSITPEYIQILEKAKNIQTVRSKTNIHYGFDFNTQKAPFDRQEVRQAFRLIANRTALVQQALNGEGRVANDLYSPQDAVYLDLPQRKQNIEEAKKLLAQAGFQNGLTVELVSLAGDPSKAAVVFAEHAKLANVTVNVRQVDSATFNSPQRANWQISTNAGNVGTPYLSTAVVNDAPIAATNKINFKDPEYSKLFLKGLSEPDLGKRREILHQAQKIQHERGGLLIWGFGNVIDAANQNIGGLTVENTQFATWRFEKLWKI